MPCPSWKYWSTLTADCQLSPGLLDFYRKYNSLQNYMDPFYSWWLYWPSMMTALTMYVHTTTKGTFCQAGGRLGSGWIPSDTANTYLALDNSHWTITVRNWKLWWLFSHVKHVEVEMWTEGAQSGLPASASRHNKQRLREAEEWADVSLFPPLAQTMDCCHTVWSVLDHANS